MTRVDGLLATQLDFGEGSAKAGNPGASGRRPTLGLARTGRLTGPDKYKVLEARRRHAQIRAHRLLDRMDHGEIGR